MNEDKIMSAEAFNELIDGFEIVGSLTEYGRKNVKYHVKKLQEENQQLKEQLEASEKARKEAIDKLKKWGEEPDYDMYMKMKEYKEHKEVLNILDIDKGE